MYSVPSSPPCHDAPLRRSRRLFIATRTVATGTLLTFGLLLFPGCHQAADLDTSAPTLLVQHGDALPPNLPATAPLFAASVTPTVLPALLVTREALPPKPPDAGLVAQQAATSDTATPPPSRVPTAMTAVSPINAGLWVCDPVSDAPALTDFGIGCGHWLHLMAAGQAALTRTPMWEDRRRVEQELGRTNLRLTPAQAVPLAAMTGATHAACGRLTGTPEHCTLTYQLYALPDSRPVGVPLSQSGSLAQVTAALPGMVRDLDARLGVTAAHVPAVVGLSPEDLIKIAGTLHGTALSDADMLMLSRLAAQSPLAGMLLLDTKAVDDQLVLNKTIKTLMAQQPENPLVLNHIGYIAAAALRPYAAPTQALIRREPQNYLLAHTEVWEQRVWGTRTGEWKATQRAVHGSPGNPDAWLSQAWTAGQIASDLRQGRFAGDITPREWGYLRRLYTRQEACTEQATRLDPKDGHAWAELAQAATFTGDSPRAADALWLAQKLDPDKLEVYAWGIEMFQPKWYSDPTALDKVANLAASEVYDSASAAINISASLKGLQWGTKDPKYVTMGTDVLSRYITRQRDAVRLRPGDAWEHWNLAAALAASKDPVSLREATQEYQIAAHLLPNCVQIHYWLSDTLDKRHRKTEAIAELRRTIALDPFFAKAHFDLGYDLKHERQFPEALSELRLAMRLDPRNAEAHYGLGDLLEMQHEHGPALAEYREAVRMFPYFIQAWGGMCLVSEETGHYDETLKAGHEAIRVIAISSEPNAEFEAPLHDDMADAYLHKKEWNASLQESQAALGLNPNDACAYENFGEAYIGQGRKAEAHASWERVISLGDPRITPVARKMLAEYP